MNYQHLKSQWEQIQRSLGDSDFEFDLSRESIAELIDEFNVKVQSCSIGHICFKGHNIGHSQKGKTSGRALGNFLKQGGLSLDSSFEDFVQKLMTC